MVEWNGLLFDKCGGSLRSLVWDAPDCPVVLGFRVDANIGCARLQATSPAQRPGLATASVILDAPQILRWDPTCLHCAPCMLQCWMPVVNMCQTCPRQWALGAGTGADMGARTVSPNTMLLQAADCASAAGAQPLPSNYTDAPSALPPPPLNPDATKALGCSGGYW